MTVTHTQQVLRGYHGLSTDTRPTNPMIGSTFYETDTRLTYVFADEWVRTEQLTVEQAERVLTRESTYDMAALLQEILMQLKIQNMHLSLLTEVSFVEGDM